MSDYEDRRQARIDRYREKADQARAQSDALWHQSETMASAIPMGQPIHGPADRRYRDRIMKKMEQSFTASERAAYYGSKAQAAEENTAISADDPEAIAKLTEKLEGLQIAQTQMTQINAYYRKNGTCRGFHGLSDEEADRIDGTVEHGYSWQKVPYTSYALSFNNKEIHRIKDRCKQSSKMVQNSPQSIPGGA